MFPCARHVTLYLVLVKPRKRPNITENFLTGIGGSGGGGQGVLTPPHTHTHTEISQKIGFLSNTGPDSLKIAKLLGQNSMLGHHHLNVVSLAGR